MWSKNGAVIFIFLKAWLSMNILITLRTYFSHPKLMFSNNWTDSLIPCECFLFFFLFQKIRNMRRIIMSRWRRILAEKFNFESSLKNLLIYFMFFLSKYTLFCKKWISKIWFLLAKLQLISTEHIDRKLVTLLLPISQSWMIPWFALFINTTLMCRLIQRPE